MTPLRMGRRWPLVTVAVLAATVVLTVLQYPFPEVRLALWRDPRALAAGQWWRLVTPLLVQYDPVWQIVVVLTLIAGIGVLAERVYEHGRFLLLYFGCGVVGQAFGYRWAPPDAGASVAGAGLLGGVCAWLLSPAGPRLARVRVWAVAWPLAGIVLTAAGDYHGPPLLLGFGLGALLLWRDRRLSPVAASRHPKIPAGRAADLGAGVEDTPPPEDEHRRDSGHHPACSKEVSDGQPLPGGRAGPRVAPGGVGPPRRDPEPGASCWPGCAGLGGWPDDVALLAG